MNHMKLRWFIFILMILNAVFYVWREGVLESWASLPPACASLNASNNKFILKIF